MLRVARERGTKSTTTPCCLHLLAACHLATCQVSCQCSLCHSSRRAIPVHAHSRNSQYLTPFMSFFSDKYSILHIHHAAGKIVFCACCLDILTEATHSLYSTRHCLFVVLFLAFVLSLLSPSRRWSCCLNAD